MKPVAANVSRLLIVCAPLPEPDTLLIDQFCVVALNNGLTPVVVLNKSDLLQSQEHAKTRDHCEDMLAVYAAAGIKSLSINTLTETAWSPLMSAIENEVAVLVGQSGVGKSSIIQKILPDKDIRVGEVSRATGIGAHTTTVSFWYDLENNGALIDSPGVRQFSVDYLDPPALAYGYPEIRELAASCRFNNCRHRVEPGCAVLASMESATPEVSQWRYKNFIKLSDEFTG